MRNNDDQKIAYLRLCGFNFSLNAGLRTRYICTKCVIVNGRSHILAYKSINEAFEDQITKIYENNN